LVIYQQPSGKTTIDVKNKSTTSRHIFNIYREEELLQEANVAKNETVQKRETRIITYFLNQYYLNNKRDVSTVNTPIIL